MSQNPDNPDDKDQPDTPAVLAAAAQDPWHPWREHTPARIALGRSGISLPTRELLSFAQAHALARDAVHTPLDLQAIRGSLHKFGLPLLEVRSAAPDRAAYLARPDWGRQLHPESVLPAEHSGMDVLIVIADGLSAAAVHRHAHRLVEALLPLLAPLRTGPLVIAQQARVAIADPIGEQLKAGLTVNLIGERPGLSAPDSLGAYITHGPKVGRTDAHRNCISNIRPEGLHYALAAEQIANLVHAAFELGGSGVSITHEAKRKAFEQPK